MTTPDPTVSCPPCPRCRGAVAVTSASPKGDAVARCAGCGWIWKGRVVSGQLEISPAAPREAAEQVALAEPAGEERVRRLEAQLRHWARERVLLARLAAETPQFDNPLHVVEAQQIRDQILAGHRRNTETTTPARPAERAT